MSLRDHRKKGNKKGFSSSDGDEGGFGFTDLGNDIEGKLKSPLSEKDRKKVEKLQEERKKRLERERQKKTSSFGGSKQGGTKMYRRPLRPEDVRSLAVEKAAEKVVEAEPEGKESSKYRDAMKELKECIEAQRKNSPRETFRTAFSLQRELIRKEIDRNVLFVLARAMGKKQLAFIAVAVCNVREALRKKGVDLQKERVTDKADAPSLEKLLIVLAANGLEDQREYLAGKISLKLRQKIEVRIARRLVIDRRPDLAEEIPSLSLDRKSELTQEYVGKVLGGVKVVGAAHQYKVLAKLMEDESWRVPIFPKGKVEAPSETAREEGTSKGKPAPKEEPTTEKSAPAVEKKDKKSKDEPVKDKPVKDKPVKKTVEVKEAAPKKSLVTDETLIDDVKGLSALAVKSLKAAGFSVVGDFQGIPRERITGIKNLGPKSLKILEPLIK